MTCARSTGDSLVDLIALSKWGLATLYRNTGKVEARWAPGQLANATGSWPILVRMTCGDLNGDAHVDLVVAYIAAEVLTSYSYDFEYLFALAYSINDGHGRFGPIVFVGNMTMQSRQSFSLVDVDLDGWLDILANAASKDTKPSYFRNRAGSGFNAIATVVPGAYSGGTNVHLADMDGDGLSDMLMQDDWTGAIGWLRRIGGAIFAPRMINITIVDFGMQRAGVTLAADLNSDDAIDVVADGAAMLCIFLNNGSGGFDSAGQVIAVPFELSTYLMAADILYNDGLLDIVTASLDGALIFRNVAPLARARLTAGQRELPAVCGGVPGSASCLGALIATHSTCPFASSLALPAPIHSCFPSPLAPTNIATLLIYGHANASSINCTSRKRQSLILVPADSSIMLQDVRIMINATASRTVVSGPAVLSVCSSACADDDVASLGLANVTLIGFDNRRPESVFEPDGGTSAVSVSARGQLVVQDSLFADNASPLGGGAIVLRGTGSSARIVRTRFERNRALGAFADTLGGGGAIAVNAPNIVLELINCTFVANEARGGAGGGALAVNGPDAKVTLDGVSLLNNAALDGGSGGAIVIRPSASGTRLTMAGPSTIADCRAEGGAGGAIAVLGAASSAVVLGNGTTISSCTAAYGGALGALQSHIASPEALDRNAMGKLGRAGAVSVASISLASTVRIADSLGVFGGTVFACGARVSLGGAVLTGSSHAMVAGGRAFFCLASDSTARPDTLWLDGLPVADAGGTVASGGYGAQFASPPRTLALFDFAGRAMSGAALGAGRAQLVDAFGATVRDSAIALRSELDTTASSASMSSAAMLVTLQGSDYAFGGLAIAASDWPTSLGQRAVIAFGIDAGGVLSDSPVARLSVNVSGCDAGWGRVSAGDSSEPLVCAACTGDTSTSESVAAVGGICEGCPANTVGTAAGGTLCLCQAGFFSPSGQASVACEPCPVGAVCAGRLDAPTAAPGFFPDSSGAFVACVSPRACLGGGRCARGYSGRLCGTCASGWYALNGACRKCQRALAALASVGLVLLALGVAAALLWFNLATSVSYKFATASIGLMAVQMLALFGKLQVDFGPIAEPILRVASTLSLNIQLTSPECSLSASVDAWLLRFWLTMALPVFAVVALLAAAAALFGLSRLLPGGRLASLSLAVLGDALIRSWFQALTLLFMPLIATALSVFGCRRDAAGVWVLLDDPSRRCFDARWRTRLLGPGLLFSILYGAAVPLGFVVVLQRKRQALSPGEFVLRYSFAVLRFAARLWYFEAVLMGVKLALVLALTLFASDETKVGMGTMVLVASLAQLLAVRPYVRPMHQGVAVITQACVAMTLFGAMFANELMRRLIASLGVLLTLAAVVVGLILDMRQYRLEDARAAKSFSAEPFSAVDSQSDDVVALDFMSDVRRGTLGSSQGICQKAELVISSTDPSITSSGLAIGPPSFVLSAEKSSV